MDRYSHLQRLPPSDNLDQISRLLPFLAQNIIKLITFCELPIALEKIKGSLLSCLQGF